MVSAVAMAIPMVVVMSLIWISGKPASSKTKPTMLKGTIATKEITMLKARRTIVRFIVDI